MTNSGWLTYDEIKLALSNGHAVSVGLEYEKLGDYRADWYKKKNIFVGGHQVVVIGYSELDQTWTIFDPLQPEQKATKVTSTVFRQAVDAQGGNGAQAWYFK